MATKKLSILLTILLSMASTWACAYDFQVDKIYYNYNPTSQSAIVTFGDEKYTGELTIPSSIMYNGRQLDVKEIGYKACYQCEELSTVILPNSIIRISDEAFRECKKLASIKMSESIEEIGDYAFYECTSIELIDLPNKLKTIGWYAFSNTSLKSTKIPKTVTSINAVAYGGCYNLKTIIFEESNEIVSLGSGTLGGGNSDIFSGVKPTALYLGRPIQDRYGNTNYSFADSLVTLTIGNYMKNQEDYELLSDNLSTMYINRTKTIKTIYSTSETPMDLNGWCFDNKVYLEAKLYVPTGTKNKYLSTNGWKNFFQIEEMDIDKMWIGEGEPNTITPSNEKCATPTIAYQNGKLTYSCDTEGAIFHSTIKDDDIKSYDCNDVQLGVTYNISVYAAKEGYQNSETATATLCWIDVEPKTEGITDGIAQMAARAVMVKAEGGVLTIEGAKDETSISAYYINGAQAGATTSRNGIASIITTIPKDSVVILKIGNKSVKVIMK